MNFNVVRLIQLLLNTAQLLFLKEMYWCLKQKAGWKSSTKGEWLRRVTGTQETWLRLGCNTSGTARAMLGIPHVLPSPVLHLCTATYNQTPWSNLGTKINFTAYAWCVKTKTLHGNSVSNNIQVPCGISADCQANGEEATFLCVLKCPWSMLYVDTHIGFVCGKGWGSEMFVQTTLLAPWGCGMSMAPCRKSVKRACMSNSSAAILLCSYTRSHACAKTVTTFTHSYLLAQLSTPFICTMLRRHSSCKKDAVYLSHLVLHRKCESEHWLTDQWMFFLGQTRFLLAVLSVRSL